MPSSAVSVSSGPFHFTLGLRTVSLQILTLLFSTLWTSFSAWNSLVSVLQCLFCSVLPFWMSPSLAYCRSWRVMAWSATSILLWWRSWVKNTPRRRDLWIDPNRQLHHHLPYQQADVRLPACLCLSLCTKLDRCSQYWHVYYLGGLGSLLFLGGKKFGGRSWALLSRTLVRTGGSLPTLPWLPKPELQVWLLSVFLLEG